MEQNQEQDLQKKEFRLVKKGLIKKQWLKLQKEQEVTSLQIYNYAS